ADDGARLDRRRTVQLGAGQDGDVGGKIDLDVDPGGGRVDDRHAVEHPAVHGAAVELSPQGRELGPVVDTFDQDRVGDDLGGDAPTGSPSDAEDIGEVHLALRVVGTDRGERLAQRGGVEGVDP